MQSCELHFDILDDLSSDIPLRDYFKFLCINESTYELNYKVVGRVEYYYEIRDVYKPLSFAFRYADNDAIKWFHYNTNESFKYTLGWARSSGNLDIAKWVYGHIPDERTIHNIHLILNCGKNNGSWDSWIRVEWGPDDAGRDKVNYRTKDDKVREWLKEKLTDLQNTQEHL